MYRNELLSLVRLLRNAVTEEVLPVLRGVESQFVRDAPDGGSAFGFSFVDAIERALNAAARRFGGLDQWASRIAAAQAKRVDQQVTDTIGSAVRGAFGLDIGPVMQMQDLRAQLDAATAVNVQLIKSVKQQYFDRVGSTVLNGVMQGQRAAELAQDIQHITSVSESRAKLIARDQTSKMTAAITEARQTELGIDEYTWQTSGDERVRPEHAAHDGQIYKWSNPPADTGHPGTDISCRCVAIPYVRIEGY